MLIQHTAYEGCNEKNSQTNNRADGDSVKTKKNKNQTTNKRAHGNSAKTKTKKFKKQTNAEHMAIAPKRLSKSKFMKDADTARSPWGPEQMCPWDQNEKKTSPSKKRQRAHDLWRSEGHIKRC